MWYLSTLPLLLPPSNHLCILYLLRISPVTNALEKHHGF